MWIHKDSIMAAIALWSMLCVLSITRCSSSVVEKNDLLAAMKERLETIEKKLELMPTHAHVESLEKKVEFYILKNDELLQENQALTQLVYGFETKNSEMAAKVATLTSIIFDLKKNFQNRQKVNHKLTKEKSTNSSYLNSDVFMAENTSHAERSRTKARYSDRSGSMEKRINPTTSEPSNQVAFYAFRSSNEPAKLPQHHTLIFDTVMTNKAAGYQKGDGIFIAPSSGVYVFAWTIAVETGGWASAEIVVNSNVLGTAFAEDYGNWDEGTGIVVVDVNIGDHVFIRMQENGNGIVHSNHRGRTSFSGWKLH